MASVVSGSTVNIVRQNLHHCCTIPLHLEYSKNNNNKKGAGNLGSTRITTISVNKCFPQFLCATYTSKVQKEETYFYCKALEPEFHDGMGFLLFTSTSSDLDSAQLITGTL